MRSQGRSIGKELLNAPMGDMIREMALAIADAQIRLDENSIEVAQMMGGLKSITDDDGNVTFSDSRVFFGEETVTLEEAVSIHNSTSDRELKGIIDAKYLESGKPFEGDVTKNATSGEYSVNSASANKTATLKIPTRLSMMELGFTPTFYQFVDTIVEVRLSISMTEEFSSDVKVDSNTKSRSFSSSYSRSKGNRSSYRRRSVTTTQVNATYASKYNYSAEGSSLMRTKLTPIPPPAILEERIRMNMEALSEE